MSFEITISDNGRASIRRPIESESGAAGGRAGDGLSNMCRRLADIGGHCLIESAPGQGTNIRFVIPLNASNKR